MGSGKINCAKELQLTFVNPGGTMGQALPDNPGLTGPHQISLERTYMSSVDTSPRDVKAIVARYKAMGLFGGLFLGAIVGVMIIGPNLRDWSWARSLATFLGAASLGGIAGYFAGELALGGGSAGPGSAISTDSDGHSHPPGLDASGGGSGDGGGGGDH